ncbi:MAG: dTDP-4-amino-4,6-dideoxygalactose transaminase [Bacteroidales bacterium]
MKIPFNKPYFTGNETVYLMQSAESGHISGNGVFTKKCHDFFENEYKFQKVLLTTSCTDALEMAALLIDIKPGEEVIIPSFTFVSTANAFILRGAKVVFADSNSINPNIDADQIENLITNKTKAIVLIHYAGIACDMDKIMALANKYNLFVVEDAAHAIDSYYNGIRLGSFGHLSTFSFHETKNIISGEGGLLVINDKKFNDRAEIIWEKGTNRAAFHRGEVNKYGWLDVGSSFLPSDLTAAVLYAQLENLEDIQKKRKKIWKIYFDHLHELETSGFVKLPSLPEFATNNGHMFYMVCGSKTERDNLIAHLNANEIQAVFHYLPLHKSKYYLHRHDGRELPKTIKYSECIIRLPFYCDLSEKQQKVISEKVNEFFRKK